MSEFSHRETALSYFSLFRRRKRCLHRSEGEMKKGRIGCLLLLMPACSASPASALLQGHPLLDRDPTRYPPTSHLGIENQKILVTLTGNPKCPGPSCFIGCSGCVKPSDASPISPSSPLHPTNPFTKPSISPCPQSFCQRPSLKEKMICCPLMRGRFGRIKCPNSCD